MSLIGEGLGGRQLILQGLGESVQSTSGSIQSRQQSSGTGYVGDQIVIPQGGFGTFRGAFGGRSISVPKPVIIGVGHSIQNRQLSDADGTFQGMGLGVGDFTEDEVIAMLMMAAAEDHALF